MAVALPSDYLFAIGSSYSQDDGIIRDLTDDGEMNLRDMYSVPRYNMSLKFTVLTSARRDALISFFNNYRMSEITFTLDGVNYIGKRSGGVNVSLPYGAGYSDVEVTMRVREDI